MSKKPVTSLYKKAKKLAEEKNVEKALPMLETLLIHFADKSMNGVKEIEGVKTDLWKSRCWDLIENMGCLPEYREDKEK